MSQELTNLPTAALVTATVAVSLFIIKEILEFVRKGKERKRNQSALDCLAAIQGINIIKQLLFISYLYNQVTLNSSRKFFTNYHGRINFVEIDNFEGVIVPKNIERLSDEAILSAAKLSDDKFRLFANINEINANLSEAMDVFLEHIKTNRMSMILDDLKRINFSKSYVDKHLKTLEPISDAMKKIKLIKV